jgi:regulatory protein
LRESELQRARDVWQRRFEKPPQDAAERAKQARFLAARGFDGDVIRRVLRPGTDGEVDPRGMREFAG